MEGEGRGSEKDRKEGKRGNREQEEGLRRSMQVKYGQVIETQPLPCRLSEVLPGCTRTPPARAISSISHLHSPGDHSPRRVGP